MMTDDDEPRYRSSYRRESRQARETPVTDERLRQSALTDTIDLGVRRIVTGLVIAGGLIGLGLYAGSDGGAEAPDYQMATTSDGRIVRLNTDSGSIVVCQNNDCWLMQRGSSDLDEEPPTAQPKQDEARPALPAPQTAPDNAAAAPEG